MNVQSIICSRVHHLHRKFSCKATSLILLSNFTRTTYSTNAYSEEIIIPRKIPRGPTDILKALESTLGRDPTAPHYKYHDDPYLIPHSNLDKRALAMAQEAGRKAAHWVRKENVDLFQHKEAEPFIDLFAPPKIYSENSEVTIDDLKQCICAVNVSDAIITYKLLKEKSVEIEPEVMQNFLELLCFYNTEDSISEEYIEERWFKQSSKGNERQRKTWKDGSFAEEIFISIKEPNAETYCAIIQGMVKYYQINRAGELFEEANKNGFILNTDTYNAIIEAGNLLKENYDLRWSYIVNLLSEMNEKKVKPNIGTLNSILYCLASMGTKIPRSCALKTISEFRKKFGIEPSLASWNYVLQIYCKEVGPVSTVLFNILNEIENKEHSICDIRDVNFFLTAMSICRYHLNDLTLARRLDGLLHYGNNYDLIGDSYREAVYYRNYFILAVKSEPFHDFMENVYGKLVPHIYTPEMGVIEEILKQIEISAATEYLPQLWSDMIIFDCVRKDTMLQLVLDIMVSNEPKNNPNLTEKFSNIASDISQRLMNQNSNKTNLMVVTGDMLGNVIVLLLRNKLFDEAWNLFVTLDKSNQNIVGVPKMEAISDLVQACIEKSLPSKAIVCIQYASDYGYDDVNKLAKQLQEKLTLDETHIEKISRIVGQHVIINKEEK